VWPRSYPHFCGTRAYSAFLLKVIQRQLVRNAPHKYCYGQPEKTETEMPQDQAPTSIASDTLIFTSNWHLDDGVNARTCHKVSDRAFRSQSHSNPPLLLERLSSDAQ
jgi:hypothetical protein